MMILGKWMAAVGVAATIAFGGTVQASHIALMLTEGEEFTAPMGLSFCVSEGSAVSVVEEQAENGMPQAVKVYQIYVGMGECGNVTGTVFTPVRLVTRWENSMVVEVVFSNGKTAFLLSPNASWNEVVGDPA